MRKIITKKKAIIIIILLLLAYAINFVGSRIPIITGYAAKGMCSCVFVAGRDPNSINKYDLNFLPINLAKTFINFDQKYVTGTIFGLAKKKAVFRKGFGCSLVSAMPDNLTQSHSGEISSAEPESDSLDWPVGSKITNPFMESINMAELNKVVENAFDNSGDNPVKKTSAVLVVYKNHLIAEKYAEGFSKNTLILGWSMTKSFINALTGILVKEGKLNIDLPAPVEEWHRDNRNRITVNNLLHMNSGLAWTENYFNLSDVTKMLYKNDNMYEYAIRSKMEFPPDSIWFYSSGTANILSGIIRKTINDDNEYYKFPYEKLFKEIGMNSAMIEPDASGTFVGSSYSFATARDWAKFGILYLNDGVWFGKRILPVGWVKYTTTPARGSDDEYGALFWLNKGNKLPDVPPEMYCSDGFKGQRVFIIPSRDLVIVRMGFSSTRFDFNKFVSSIIKTLPN